jgi:hypothetical protein
MGEGVCEGTRIVWSVAGLPLPSWRSLCLLIQIGLRSREAKGLG